MTQNVHSQDLKLKIRKFILENFPIAKRQDISDDGLLLGSGIIDSIGILQIVTFLEGEFAITVDDEEFIPENFQTIAHISTFVQSKR